MELKHKQIIDHTKSIFARQGIPEVVISDNRPQSSYETNKQLAEGYHSSMSPAVLIIPEVMVRQSMRLGQ